MNYLMLNVSKTKEQVIDFCQKPYLPDLVIKGEKVERVSQYKYLGTVLDSKLNFDQNTALIQKKCHSRMYLLQKLRNLNVNPSVLQMFYLAFIESVLTFSFLGWFGSLSVKNKAVLARVVNACSRIVGERQASLSELHESCAVRKGRKIVGDSAHVLVRHYMNSCLRGDAIESQKHGHSVLRIVSSPAP